MSFGHRWVIFRSSCRVGDPTGSHRVFNERETRGISSAKNNPFADLFKSEPRENGVVEGELGGAGGLD